MLPLFLSLSLSVCICSRVPHNDIAIYLPSLLFFRSYNEVFVQTAFIPYFPSGKYYFSICDHGPDSLHAVYMRQIDIFYRGMLRRSRRLQIFL